MSEQDGEGQSSQHIAAWRVALKNFSSQVNYHMQCAVNYMVICKQWFSVPQGTGILYIILHSNLEAATEMECNPY